MPTHTSSACKSTHPFVPGSPADMRPLTEAETRTLFQKLADYTGRSLNNLIAPSATSGESAHRFVFRIQKDRVYYVREELANLATSVARISLLSLGTCIGKFTKTGKFRIHITALDIIAPHARYKVWVKPNGEMPFLYGGNIVKAHVGRWSEDCPQHQGVVVLSMDDTPLVCPIESGSALEPMFRLADVACRDSVSQQDLRQSLGAWSLRASPATGKQILENIFEKRILFSRRHEL